MEGKMSSEIVKSDGETMNKKHTLPAESAFRPGQPGSVSNIIFQQCGILFNIIPPLIFSTWKKN